MKLLNNQSPFSAVALLSLLAITQAPAALVYVDANGGVSGNTVRASNGSQTDWLGTTSADNLWTNRANFPANGVDALEGINSSENLPTLRTTITGLQANTVYTGLRLYMIGNPDNATNYGLNYSFDNINFTSVTDEDAGRNAVNTANSGLGTSITETGTNVRYYFELPNATTDGSGNLNIYIAENTDADRGYYDGIAYDTVAVPEPSAALLGGLGVLALLRRRRA